MKIRKTRKPAGRTGPGHAPRRRRFRRVWTSLLVPAVIALLIPSAAFADSGKGTPRVEGFAFYVLGEPRCHVRPDRDAASGPLRPRPGMLVEVSDDAFRGPSISDRTDRWRWTQEVGNPRLGCYVADSGLTSLLPSNPNQIDWVEGGGMMGAVDGAMVLGALVTRGNHELLAAPTTESEVLAEPENGTLLDVPADMAKWTVTGNRAFSGPRTFLPVRMAGVIAWARSESVTAIPAIDTNALNDTVTAAGDLDVIVAPSPYGQVVTTLAAGQTARTGTPFGGYQPVALDDGRVGWISQQEALAAAVVDPSVSASPATDPTPVGERVDAWADEILGDEAGPGAGLHDRVAAVWDRATRDNPAARAVSWSALLASGFGAVVALGLLAVAAVARSLRKSAHTVVAASAAGAAALMAAAMAPTAHFHAQVATGIAVVGGALALTLAFTIASLRRVPLDRVVRVVSSTRNLGLLIGAAAAPVGLALLSERVDWPVGALLGLTLAGAAAGLQSEPGQAPDANPAHPSGEPADAGTQTLDSGW